MQFFWKSIKIWQSYREFTGGNFFETQCITFKGHPKWSPWAVYINSVGSNIVTVAVLDTFHVKKYDLDFWPLKLIQGGIWKKSSLGVNLLSVTVFKIFRVKKRLRPWPLTSQGHPKWTQWVLCVISVGSTIVTVAVFHIFHVKIWPWFLTAQSHPRLNLTVPIQSPWILRISAP